MEFSEYDPISWMQLRNGNTVLMLVTYDYAKKDIDNFKKYTVSTNLYKFRYNTLEEIKEMYNNLKNGGKEIFLDFRKADFRYEFGVYDEDRNLILVTKVADN